MIPLLLAAFLISCDGMEELRKSRNFQDFKAVQQEGWVHYTWVEKIDSAQIVKKLAEEVGGLDAWLYVWTDSVDVSKIPTIGDAHKNAEAYNYAAYARKKGDKVSFGLRTNP